MDLLHRLVVLNLLVGYLSACSSGQFASSEKVDRRDDRLAIDAGNRPQNVPQGGVNTNYWPSRGQGDSEFPEMNQGNRGQSPDPISQGTERPQQPGGTPTETEPTPPSGGGSPSPPAPPPSPPPGTPPPSSTVIDYSRPGPYTIMSYTQGLADASYASAVVFYPVSSVPTETFPATTVSGGFSNVKEDMEWLSRHLASWGFIVIAFTPTVNVSLDPGVWATGHVGGIGRLKSENLRADSPIRGRVAVDRLAISGFSMGGAGTILAVNRLAGSVQAAAPICAFNPVVPSARTPVLMITGTADTVAAPGAVVSAYAGSAVRPKALANFNGMTHFDVYQTSPEQPWIGQYITAWYQLHLRGMKTAESYFNGAQLDKNRAGRLFAADGDFQYMP